MLCNNNCIHHILIKKSMNMMKFDDKNFLAEQIRLHRRKMGLTQAELSEKVDLSVQHISRIESGCYLPSLKSFFMLVSVLNIDLRVFGFNPSSTEESDKNELIKSIINASKAELVFYENLISAVSKSISKIKNDFWE